MPLILHMRIVNMPLLTVNHITRGFRPLLTNIVIMSHFSTNEAEERFDTTLFESVLGTDIASKPILIVNKTLYVDLVKGINVDIAQALSNTINNIHASLSGVESVPQVHLQIYFINYNPFTRSTTKQNLELLSTIHTQLTILQDNCKALTKIPEKDILTKTVNTLLTSVARAVQMKYVDERSYKDPRSVMQLYVERLFKKINNEYNPVTKCSNVSYNHAPVTDALLLGCDMHQVTAYVANLVQVRDARRKVKKDTKTKATTNSSTTKTNVEGILNNITPSPKPIR